MNPLELIPIAIVLLRRGISIAEVAGKIIEAQRDGKEVSPELWKAADEAMALSSARREETK